MFKKTLVLLLVAVLLIGGLVLPASATVVKDVFTWQEDGQVVRNDGIHKTYKLDIPIECFDVRIIKGTTEVVSKQGEASATLSPSSTYSIIMYLSKGYLISLHGLPDVATFEFRWDIEHTSAHGYDTPRFYSFIDYYRGGVGPGADANYVTQDLTQRIDIDDTGRYSVTDVQYDDYIAPKNFDIDLDSFIFGINWRGFVPFENEKHTFTIHNVEVYVKIPATYDLAGKQDETNEKLDDVNQNLEELPGQVGDEMQGVLDAEKEQASNAGDSAAGELMDIIPNESEGFMEAVKKLVNAMSYQGTAAQLPIPPIVLPAIKGVMPQIKLTDTLYVNFGYWVNKLPPDVLQLVQILATIALIVYCFKELYGTIAYALTLKGGGSGE